MPVVTPREAVQLLTHEVEEKLPPGEIIEIHDALFPARPLNGEEMGGDRKRLTKAIVDYLNGGLLEEEVVDVWRLIVPKHRNVWYDEEADRIHYNEEPAPQTID